MAGISFGSEGPAFSEILKVLKRLPAEAYPAAIEGVHNWFNDTFDVAQQIVPTDKGFLGSSGDVIENPDGGEIVYTAPYAAAVHDGYARHWVEPKRRKVLAWEVGRKGRLEAKRSRKSGKMAFSKGHFVPARAQRSKPQPWLMNSVRKMFPHLADYIIDQVDGILEA